MRIANLAGRLVLLDGNGGCVDVEELSQGRFPSDPQEVYTHWESFHAWAASASLDGAQGFDPGALDAIVSRPPQIFAVGLNYRGHAEEAGLKPPPATVVFNKYVSDLTGPVTNIRLSPANVDWEVEMVAVVGIGGRHISEADGWAHIAGLTLGQDISDRVTQFAAPPTQFGLAKSYPGYSPIGPFLVTIDELQEAGLNLDDLELGCEVNGRIRQKAQTKDLIFSVPALVARISEVVTLIAGDIIFTGTPSGVGMGMTPPQYLKAGDELISWCEGIGEMRHHFIND